MSDEGLEIDLAKAIVEYRKSSPLDLPSSVPNNEVQYVSFKKNVRILVIRPYSK
jgi:hypothetical protein